jgi:DNA-binding transcriptional MerR regulator
MAEKVELITREEAALRLGFGVSEIRRRERLGQIKYVKKGAHNTYLYNAEEIRALGEAIANQKGGYTIEDARAVFKLLQEGKTLIECVTEGNVHPDAVENLAHQYATLAKCVFLSTTTLKKINAMAIDGPLPVTNETEMVEFFAFLETQMCLECAKKPRAYCKACVHNTIRAAKAKATSVAEGTDEL